MSRLLVARTVGDSQGIGPEIVLRLLAQANPLPVRLWILGEVRAQARIFHER